jgi:hypothetical protein
MFMPVPMAGWPCGTRGREGLWLLARIWRASFLRQQDTTSTAMGLAFHTLPSSATIGSTRGAVIIVLTTVVPRQSLVMM